jgi:peptidoglycan/LPS O-acetylase OafA/YrhL
MSMEQPQKFVEPVSRRVSGYLPSLDGWRAFAILGVLMTHDLPWRFGHHTTASFKGYGGYGVYLFFAISGILICTRILEEESLVGKFHLKSFYIRRVLRIQPASFVYLAVIALFIVAGIVHESWHYWRGALFFYANFLYRASDNTGTGAFTGHFWTLSVEEHFYILLSLLLFFFRKHRIKIFASLILIIWGVQIVARRHGLFVADTSSRRTNWVILYLLTPALLALLLHLPNVKAMAIRFLSPWVAYLATLGLMLADRLRVYNGVGFWSINILSSQGNYLFFGFSLWVIATMLHPRSLSTRFLELRPLKWIGRLSYSLYLWHVFFFVPVYSEVRITAAPVLFLSERPWKYIASFAAAILSYYLIEKPFIRLGHRLAPPATPGHKDLEIEAIDNESASSKLIHAAK